MSDPSIHYQLGAILAEVKNLKEDYRRSEDKSDIHRAGVHRRMDELTSRVGSLETSVKVAADDIDSMKPVTDDVRKWKLMGIGALGVVGLGGAALGVSLAGALQKLVHFFSST